MFQKSIDLRDYIRSVPDFPKPGIDFKDISPLLKNPRALRKVVDRIANCWVGEADVIVGLDARGFIFGALVAEKLRLPLVMMRKKGKLPGPTFSKKYDLEYGEGSILEVQQDAIPRNSKVLLVDDLLATGGTTLAACELTEETGSQVIGCAFVIELKGLGGRKRLESYKLQSLITL